MASHIHISEKEFVSRIYKELNINNKKTRKLIKNGQETVYREFIMSG